MKAISINVMLRIGGVDQNKLDGNEKLEER